MIAVVNHSNHVPDRDFVAMTQASNLQIKEDVAPAWTRDPQSVVPFTSEAVAPKDAWLIGIFNNADQANALGWHSVSPGGRPYGRVFVVPVLGSGGSLLRGALSVAAVLSHEACETFGDPQVNRWVDDGRGSLWALELCDQVEADAYDKTVDGQPVSVSNFLYPAAFKSAGPGKLDHMGRLSKPFGFTPGGYAIVLNLKGASAQEQFGPGQRLNRQPKDHPASRTSRRLLKLAA